MKTKPEPDAMILDTQGKAHPHGIDSAPHIGLIPDKPSIGCAKTRLIAKNMTRRERTLEITPCLKTKENNFDTALKTSKPVFISPGNKIDLDTSIDLALKCCRGYRLPELIKQAHNHNLVKKTATGKSSEKK